jgi:hypothetical protein
MKTAQVTFMDTIYVWLYVYAFLFSNKVVVQSVQFVVRHDCERFSDVAIAPNAERSVCGSQRAFWRVNWVCKHGWLAGERSKQRKAQVVIVSIFCFPDLSPSRT